MNESILSEWNNTCIEDEQTIATSMKKFAGREGQEYFALMGNVDVRTADLKQVLEQPDIDNIIESLVNASTRMDKIRALTSDHTE